VSAVWQAILRHCTALTTTHLMQVCLLFNEAGTCTLLELLSTKDEIIHILPFKSLKIAISMTGMKSNRMRTNIQYGDWTH